jgi:hypothetical protein
MGLPDRSEDTPRLGWGPEWIVGGVLVLSLGAAWFQDRDAPLLGPERREVVRSQTAGAVGIVARRVRLEAPADLREGAGEEFAVMARLEPDVRVYAFGDDEGWIRATAVGPGGEVAQGWLPVPERGLREDRRPAGDASPGLRRALAAGIALDFLDRYPPVTVRAVGDDAAKLRVTAGQVRPRLAQRMHREIHWQSLAVAGFREFELSDGSRTHAWRIPPDLPDRDPLR